MKITVVGLGTAGGGIGVAGYLARAGAEVLVTDLKREGDLAGSVQALDGLKIEFHLGGHWEEDFTRTDLLVLSPSVPKESPFVTKGVAAGVPIDSEMNIFFRQCPGRIVGVTGSVGKTTTTTLLHRMVREGGIPTWLGGNIGISLLDSLDAIKPDAWVILELSSFQLEDLSGISLAPSGALVTNLHPNHLDRHKSFEAYAAAKRGILGTGPENSWAIFNRDDPVVSSWADRYQGETRWFSIRGSCRPGVYLDSGRLWIADGSDQRPLVSADTLKVPGGFNLANAAAAAAAATRIGAEDRHIRAAIEGFDGVEHRLERLRTPGPVEWFNDSKSTTPISSISAVEAFQGRLVLIAGGRSKGTGYREWGKAVAAKAWAIVLMGECRAELVEALRDAGFGGEIREAESLEAAVSKAAEVAQGAGAVVFSPGATSYDMFGNYQERGKTFKAAVARLYAAG